MPHITHRPVQPEDISAICRFPQTEEELFFMFPGADYPLTPPQLKEIISKRADSTVVLLDGKVAAFANFYQWEAGGRCAIGNVVVAPEARRKGIARYLVTEMIRLAFSRYQAAEVALSCFSQNSAGLLLYSQMGFQPYALEVRTDRHGNPAPLICMKLLRG
ncbi:MAG: GNAT family N-acetyltransferase [Desulfovibrio sp.]|uniref:GNAT family N-acetyltransferase n=1 Tax=Desulfovibrio sp. TaxID=885 RepID=UPI0039E629F7